MDWHRKSKFRMFFLALLLPFYFGPLAFADAIEYSGFLGDDDVYQRLQKIEIADGREGYRWFGPRLNLANYQSVYVKDVILYPAPEPSEQVSAETLGNITAYLTQMLTARIGQVLALSEEPGDKVLGMQLAVTAVEIKTEGMKGYEVIPVAGVFGAMKAATGTRARDVYVRVEVKLFDSVSGELVGAGIRRLEGEKLRGKKDALSIDDVRDSLDQAVNEGANAVADSLSTD